MFIQLTLLTSCFSTFMFWSQFYFIARGTEFCLSDSIFYSPLVCTADTEWHNHMLYDTWQIVEVQKKSFQIHPNSSFVNPDSYVILSWTSPCNDVETSIVQMYWPDTTVTYGLTLCRVMGVINESDFVKFCFDVCLGLLYCNHWQ